jgi:hypothetical protein
MINGAMSDANDPGLSVRLAFKEPICRRYNGFIDFKLSGFDIDCHDFAFVSRFDLLPNARLIEFLPSLSQYFFGITSLANCHRVALGFNLFLQFNPSGGGAIVEGRSDKREWLGSSSIQPTIYAEERGG